MHPSVPVLPGCIDVGLSLRSIAWFGILSVPALQMTGPMLHGGSPDQAQMMHAAQQGHVHPPYAVYNPGMMYVGPQARTHHSRCMFPLGLQTKLAYALARYP